MNSGRFSSLRQNEYTSLRGLFTTNVLRIFTDVVRVPSTSKLRYTAQWPVRPRYNKNPPIVLWLIPFIGLRKSFLNPPYTSKAPSAIDRPRSKLLTFTGYSFSSDHGG